MNKYAILPKLIVLDLDQCLWDPEMYQLYASPDIPVQSEQNNKKYCSGMKNKKHQTVSLHNSAFEALNKLTTDSKQSNIIYAAASLSDVPEQSHLCLKNLQLGNQVILNDFFKSKQVGKISYGENKHVHFQNIKKELKIDQSEMVFFDDNNRHVQDIQNKFGVISQYTPNGLDYESVLKCLARQSKIKNGE